MEKRSCSKGCGRLLDPRGARRHEAACVGKTAEATPHRGRRARPVVLPVVREPQAGRITVAPAASRGSALTLADARTQLAQMLDELQTTLRVLDRMLGERA